tara:strand:- start:62518 stop:62847 length:330 start_codon:yes stop_codon:yes gene_type:complete
MQRSSQVSDSGRVSEMSIVDTFTKLILGQEERFDDGEQLIIRALRKVEAAVSDDSHRDMGNYLRALGVREMIHLVIRVHEFLWDGIAQPGPITDDVGADLVRPIGRATF